MKLPVNYDKLHYTERKLVREEYIKLQRGFCYYCGTPLDGKPDRGVLSMPVDESLFPPNFFKSPVHLHHNHDTGMTIGAVHGYCNAVLWQYHGE
jgi:hypothetical protein